MNLEVRLSLRLQLVASSAGDSLPSQSSRNNHPFQCAKVQWRVGRAHAAVALQSLTFAVLRQGQPALC